MRAPGFLLYWLLLSGCSSQSNPPPPIAAPPRPRYVYLVNCDSTISRLELGRNDPGMALKLAWKTAALLIPVGPEVKGCSVTSPIYEPSSARLFVAAPQDAEPDENGRRTYRVLGFRLPDYVLTDAIDLERDFPAPPALSVSGNGSRLLVKVDESRVIAYDISRPRAPKLTSDSPSMTEFAVSPTAPPAGGPPDSRFLCVSQKGESLYATGGKLTIVEQAPKKASIRDPGMVLDESTACILADR